MQSHILMIEQILYQISYPQNGLHARSDFSFSLIPPRICWVKKAARYFHLEYHLVLSKACLKCTYALKRSAKHVERMCALVSSSL
uniref:Putative ovule protein n=1 Tax=Solanum chacoense TaxID=4108 RepID=A0A0V0GM35_SOLCH